MTPKHVVTVEHIWEFPAYIPQRAPAPFRFAYATGVARGRGSCGWTNPTTNGPSRNSPKVRTRMTGNMSWHRQTQWPKNFDRSGIISYPRRKNYAKEPLIGTFWNSPNDLRDGTKVRWELTISPLAVTVESMPRRSSSTIAWWHSRRAKPQECQWRRHVGPLGRSKTVPPGV